MGAPRSPGLPPVRSRWHTAAAIPLTRSRCARRCTSGGCTSGAFCFCRPFGARPPSIPSPIPILLPSPAGACP
eukprot:5068326-Heterocapsa_arctica.AAC.1